MSELREATALVLVGGAGTRLRPIVADRPKPLAEVAGRPFLAYVLDSLEHVGIRRVVLCTGYRGEQVVATFGERYGTLELLYSREQEPRGTGGALASALPLAEGEAVLALNGDSLCEGDLNALWQAHRQRNAEATLLLTRVEDASAFGTVRLAPNGRVLAFLEKRGVAAPAWVNAGVYVLSRLLLESVPSRGVVSIERDLFPLWVERRFYGFQTDAPLYDIGTPDSYTRVQRLFAERRKEASHARDSSLRRRGPRHS